MVGFGLQAYSDKVNRKDTIVTFLSKFFFFSKVDIYIYIYWLHLINMSSSNNLSLKQHRSGRNIFPATLKSLSGA